jgi:solute:Na+ symporter, SSS family
MESIEASAMNSWVMVIFPFCLAALLWIGLRSRRRWLSSNDYLNATHSVPLWAAALAFLASNCGSIEVIGLSAMAAQYGVQALHFYWIGGIPGMIFMGLVVLPVYMRTGARSLPEYLGMRFGGAVRLLNAFVSIFGTVCFAGVGLYTMAQVLHVMLGWEFLPGEMACAAVVLVYVLAGGVRASIFTSVFQLFVMVAGLAPLLLLTVHFDAANWAQRSDRWHLWKPLPLLSPRAPLDCCGVLLGLGFVISFSYWCTDFVMIQRALSARSVEDARKVPLLAGFGKMGMAFLIVLPGVAAPAILHGRATFDQTLPALMSLEFGPALLALGTAALLAGLSAWLAGNVSGFSALWVEEIYRRMRPDRSERHYIAMGHAAMPACLLLALPAAYLAFAFHDLMEYLQLIVALFYAPVFAVVVAGILSRRATQRGALAGIGAGIASAIALQIAYGMGRAPFGTQMSANFYEAILSFCAALAICMIEPQRSRQCVSSSGKVVFDAALRSSLRLSPTLALLSLVLLALCLLLNAIWW